MDLVQIRYFLALSRALNFTRAAAACNVSQPALTKSIARLEAELGGPLLLRERNLTQLTEFGRIMLPLLQQTSDAAAAAKRHAIDFKENCQQTARLRVGLAPSLPAGLFTPLFRELNRAFQGFELTASSGAAAALNDALLHGEIEVAVLDDADALAGRINRWTLFSDPAAVLMRGDHPLTAMAEIPVAALGEHALICRTGSGGCLAAMLDAIRVELGVEVMSRHRGPDEEGVRELVRAGLGVALSTARTPVTAGLVLRPLASGARQDVVAAVVAGRPLTHAAETFMRLARARDWALTPA
ncbi:MAG: LysR family transcriptional regulator [Gemmatimonadaceae bacterium]|nr:LysR family transcriptional regulator [Acetobacteraceae bacterium]